jgi:predicted molibdopterin-dependent oxidoreductase YjgC
LGCDPLADFPDRALVRDAFDGVGAVIAVDAFLSDSTRRADVVLPATLWGEKQGTVTNLEGRVQRLGRKVSPTGSAMDDWRIAAELALRLGSDFDLEQVDEVTDEIARVAPAFEGADADLLRRARDGVVLPVSEHRSEIVLRAGGLTILADDGSGASWEPIRAAGEATDDADGDATEHPEAAAVEPRLPAVVWDRTYGSAEIPGRDAYALRLVTGHTLYDGGRAVTSSPSIAALAHEVALMVSTTDLARIGVAGGATVKVTSSRTSLNLVVGVDARLPAGVARLTFAPGRPGAADLIDTAAPVTDIRVETLR